MHTEHCMFGSPPACSPIVGWTAGMFVGKQNRLCSVVALHLAHMGTALHPLHVTMASLRAVNAAPLNERCSLGCRICPGTCAARAMHFSLEYSRHPQDAHARSQLPHRSLPCLESLVTALLAWSSHARVSTVLLPERSRHKHPSVSQTPSARQSRQAMPPAT